jgi:hypothetical protein
MAKKAPLLKLKNITDFIEAAVNTIYSSFFFDILNPGINLRFLLIHIF